MSEKDINCMLSLIKTGEIAEIKKLVAKGINIHYADDYFLYLSVFEKNEELQKYFIDLGLDPEITKLRMAVSDPEGLAKLRSYKKEKEVRQLAAKLDNLLIKNGKTNKTLKI